MQAYKVCFSHGPIPSLFPTSTTFSACIEQLAHANVGRHMQTHSTHANGGPWKPYICANEAAQVCRFCIFFFFHSFFHPFTHFGPRYNDNDAAFPKTTNGSVTHPSRP